MPFPFIAVAAIGIVGAVAAVGVTAAITHELSGDNAVVQRVIDGDTLDFQIDGNTRRVRLLNVDAPEDNKTTGVSECLGAEATAELFRLLPAGTDVFLKYDDDRTDKYDRVLAGVFVDDVLVNAEMARAGLAGSMLVGGNDKSFTNEKVRARRARGERWDERIIDQAALVLVHGRQQLEAALRIMSILSGIEQEGPLEPLRSQEAMAVKALSQELAVLRLIVPRVAMPSVTLVRLRSQELHAAPEAQRDKEVFALERAVSTLQDNIREHFGLEPEG